MDGGITDGYYMRPHLPFATKQEALDYLESDTFKSLVHLGARIVCEATHMYVIHEQDVADDRNEFKVFEKLPFHHYYEGVHAFRSGKPIGSNPNPATIEAFDIWNDGYMDEKEGRTPKIYG
jgi:hypothetical protein